MIKRGVIFFVLFIFLILASGCETAKGAAEGATKDYENVKQLDKKMQEVLW